MSKQLMPLMTQVCSVLQSTATFSHCSQHILHNYVLYIHGAAQVCMKSCPSLLRAFWSQMSETTASSSSARAEASALVVPGPVVAAALSAGLSKILTVVYLFFFSRHFVSSSNSRTRN